MRKLVVDDFRDHISNDVFPVLQLRTENDPWLPRLESFKCGEATDVFIPFIPLLLSPKTTKIKIDFDSDIPIVVVASTIPRFPKLCPDLKRITINDLPRDPAITEAVSEMLLACNRDTLQKFNVDSPLTEDAREVVYRLPRLSNLWTVIQGPTSLPTVTLPNLTSIDVEYDDDLNWLQGFRGAVLGELDSVSFHSESDHIGDFIGAFENVALTTSAKDTLSEFRFYTSSSWNPNYSSLLSFNQLKEVEIEFSCAAGCSSKLDDDIIMSIAQAMPNLETLQLGDPPCDTPAGITVNGLIGLARFCPRLSKLCIHFQAATLVEVVASVTAQFPSDSKPVIRREDCALTDLEVGMIPIPARSGLVIAHILLQIFPRILNVKYIWRADGGWKAVSETINDFRRIGNFVHHTGKAHPVRTQRSRLKCIQETHSMSAPLGVTRDDRSLYH